MTEVWFLRGWGRGWCLDGCVGGREGGGCEGRDGRVWVVGFFVRKKRRNQKGFGHDSLSISIS